MPEIECILFREGGSDKKNNCDYKNLVDMFNLYFSMYQYLPGSRGWHFSYHQIHCFIICVLSLKMLLSKGVAFYVCCVDYKVCFYKKMLEPRVWKVDIILSKSNTIHMQWTVSFGLPAVALNHHVHISMFDIPSNLQYKAYQISKV